MLDIPYERLNTYEIILVSIIVGLAFVCSLREERRWVLTTYVIVGALYTILSVFKLLNEGLANNDSCYTTVTKAIISILATTGWAIMLGRKSKKREYEEGEEETQE